MGITKKEALSKIVYDLDVIAQKLEEQGRFKEASALDVISNTIEAFTPPPEDPSTINGINMRWQQFKHKVNSIVGKIKFKESLQNLFKNNQLSFAGDSWWINDYLNKLTKMNWNLSDKDFAKP